MQPPPQSTGEQYDTTRAQVPSRIPENFPKKIPKMIPCWAFGMTYPEHGKEVGLQGGAFFKKNTLPLISSEGPRGRPYLDYEGEIGLIIYRSTPQQFGYCLLNDWTDRGIQVENYNPKNMGPGFSLAKSFDGALSVGPQLVIGDESIWEHLELKLFVNDELRQRLKASDCKHRPSFFYNEVFKTEKESDWALVATGTSHGTIFQAPTNLQKIFLFASTGFSLKKAQKKWLNRFQFLRPGDRIRMESSILGAQDTCIKS